MGELACRAWFSLCRTLGWLLRSGRYSTTRVVSRDDAPHVRKQRAPYAPALLRAGAGLVRVLDTGVHVLPQPLWEERERALYRSLRGTAVASDPGGTLLLPCLSGVTLAALLEDPSTDDASRRRAIELAVAALARFHAQGFTHGDAMAENVMIDLEAGEAHWFDFETVHDPHRSMRWRRADDVRALLATCLLRTVHEELPQTLGMILDEYGDEEVTRALVPSFRSVLQRPLAFHLGQAGLSYEYFRIIAGLLQARLSQASAQAEVS